MCSSMTFALRHTQISLSGNLWHFRPPSRHLLLNTHDTNVEFLQLSGPLLDIFLFFSKTKIFHSHPCHRSVVFKRWCLLCRPNTPKGRSPPGALMDWQATSWTCLTLGYGSPCLSNCRCTRQLVRWATIIQQPVKLLICETAFSWIA